MEHHLPLLQVLRQLKNYERQIVVDHLDAQACGALKKCLQTVLKGKKKVSAVEQDKLGRCLKRHKLLFSQALSAKGGAGSERKALAKLGGNPLALVLSTAIPLLLQLLSK